MYKIKMCTAIFCSYLKIKFCQTSSDPDRKKTWSMPSWGHDETGTQYRKSHHQQGLSTKSSKILTFYKFWLFYNPFYMYFNVVNILRY